MGTFTDKDPKSLLGKFVKAGFDTGRSNSDGSPRYEFMWILAENVLTTPEGNSLIGPLNNEPDEATHLLCGNKVTVPLSTVVEVLDEKTQLEYISQDQIQQVGNALNEALNEVIKNAFEHICGTFPESIQAQAITDSLRAAHQVVSMHVGSLQEMIATNVGSWTIDVRGKAITPDMARIELEKEFRFHHRKGVAHVKEKHSKDAVKKPGPRNKPARKKN